MRKSEKLNPNITTNQLSLDDARYHVLRDFSRKTEERSNQLQVTSDNVDINEQHASQSLIPQPALPPQVEAPPVRKSKVSDYKRIIIDHVPYVEYTDVDTKNIIRNEEYDMETMALYMQVRYLMVKLNRWKMTVDELIANKISLIHAKKRHAIEHRLWFLAEQGFFIGTWSEDDQHLIEVEIQVKSKEMGENKENVPEFSEDQ